jgi:esterase/lipase
LFLYFLCLILGLVFILGPRPKVDINLPIRAGRFAATKYAGLSQSEAFQRMQEELVVQESQFPTLPIGAEKTIVFADEAQPEKTKYCVLYIHGFSATRQEVSPVPENVAKHLHANYHATRLTGHGLTGEALASATPYDWMFDTLEAWQIAEQLGEQVVIISTSTGGTLTSWLAQQEVTVGKLAALFMISPNFGPKHWAMPLFQMPWSRYWIPLISKGTHGWEPANEASAIYWTYNYPTTIIHDMDAFVNAVCDSSVEHIETPTLFIYSDDDIIVNSRKTDAVARRWGAAIKHRIAFPARPNDNNHVITGDIVNPGSTKLVQNEIVSFLERHVVNK